MSLSQDELHRLIMLLWFRLPDHLISCKMCAKRMAKIYEHILHEENKPTRIQEFLIEVAAERAGVKKK